MRKLVIGMSTNRGFTLIELMIVLVIIGITFGFALIAFGDFGESRRIMFAAEQLLSTLRLAQQQAILETSTLGLRLDKGSYQILQFKPGTGWNALSTKGIFKVNYFPSQTVMTLKSSNNASPGTPAIIINSAGDMTPFTLNFGTNKENPIAQLQGSHNGDLKLTAASTK